MDTRTSEEDRCSDGSETRWQRKVPWLRPRESAQLHNNLRVGETGVLLVTPGQTSLEHHSEPLPESARGEVLGEMGFWLLVTPGQTTCFQFCLEHQSESRP